MSSSSSKSLSYDYLTSRINSFLLKGYSGVWQRVAFHLLFWGGIYGLYLVTALFRWPDGIPFSQQMLMFVAMLPTVCFFYFIFYCKKIPIASVRILIGIGFFYLVTHWLHLISFHYIVLPDSTLSKFSTSFINTFNSIGYFDFWDSKAVSANLFSMINTLFPVGIKFAYDLYKSNLEKQNLQVESTKAELSYLRNQINPHFIFNTINNAYYYVFKNHKESGELLLKLADVIRYTIEETGEDLILLEKEITIVRQLLTIEEIRSSTHATLSISETIETDISKIKILPLALVTLVENAIKHGVGTNSKRGFVECTLKVTEESIDFSVVNSINTQSAESSLGIGLTNLKRRLQLVYDKGYELNLQNEETQYKAHLRIRI